jgi:hypothetical protein
MPISRRSRTICSTSRPSRDFGLADAGWADHQDVLRQHLFAKLFVELQAPPTVAQRDRDGALGVALADDEAVELRNDFAWREVSHHVVGPYAVSR